MGELHDRKQSDYGKADDPFANVRSADDWGLSPSLGACIRMGDKLRRLQAFYRKGSLANESVEDAFLDLAVYAIIGLLLYREESASESFVAKAPSLLGNRPCVRCYGTGRIRIDGVEVEWCELCEGTGAMPTTPLPSEMLRQELQGEE